MQCCRAHNVLRFAVDTAVQVSASDRTRTYALSSVAGNGSPNRPTQRVVTVSELAAVHPAGKPHLTLEPATAEQDRLVAQYWCHTVLLCKPAERATAAIFSRMLAQRYRVQSYGSLARGIACCRLFDTYITAGHLLGNDKSDAHEMRTASFTAHAGIAHACILSQLGRSACVSQRHVHWCCNVATHQVGDCAGALTSRYTALVACFLCSLCPGNQQQVEYRQPAMV